MKLERSSSGVIGTILDSVIYRTARLKNTEEQIARSIKGALAEKFLELTSPKDSLDRSHNIEGVGIFTGQDGKKHLAVVLRPKKSDGSVMVLSKAGLDFAAQSYGNSPLLEQAREKLAEEKEYLAKGIKTEDSFFPAGALEQIAQAKTGAIKKNQKVGPDIRYGGTIHSL